MAWSASAVHVSFIQAIVGNAQTAAHIPATYDGLGNDSIKVALFNNTTAPDNTVARASAAWNTGTWTTTNEVTDATNWTSSGRVLASKTLTTATNVFTWDAADLAGGGNVTLTNAFGSFAYDDATTVGTGGTAKMGICYNYFGSGQSVTAGTFTIVWNASGILTVTCT